MFGELRYTQPVTVLDWLLDSDPAIRWQALRDLADKNAAHAEQAEQERQLVIQAREDVYAILFDSDPEAAARLADLYRAAVAEADLVRIADHWQWRDRETDLRLPRHRIVRGLVEFTQRGDLDRLHQCEDVKCGWVYLDTSPRRNRRWCNTRDCGDRNRARAYYARQRAKTPQP